MHVQEWLETIPAVSIYALVALVIGLESLGIPLPGEIVLVSRRAAGLQHGGINPVVARRLRRSSARSSATPSATPSAARAAGRCWPARREVPQALRRRAICHAPSGPSRSGACGRSSSAASSPCCGSSPGRSPGVLRMPYWKFLIANVLGGIVWAGGTTAVIYYVGVVAESWLSASRGSGSWRRCSSGSPRCCRQAQGQEVQGARRRRRSGCRGVGAGRPGPSPGSAAPLGGRSTRGSRWWAFASST